MSLLISLEAVRIIFSFSVSRSTFFGCAWKSCRILATVLLNVTTFAFPLISVMMIWSPKCSCNLLACECGRKRYWLSHRDTPVRPTSLKLAKVNFPTETVKIPNFQNKQINSKSFKLKNKTKIRKHKQPKQTA